MSNSSLAIFDHVENLTTLSQAKAFLGREFLTWLWYIAETEVDTLTLHSEELNKKVSFDIWIDDRLVLESSSGEALESHLKGGAPSQSHEAAAALLSGKQVKEMRLGLRVEDIGEYFVTLKSQDLSPRSLKLPTPDQSSDKGGTDPDELPILTRLYYLRIFSNIMDGLVQRFMALRTTEDWDAKGVKDIRSWIKSRGNLPGFSIH